MNLKELKQIKKEITEKSIIIIPALVIYNELEDFEPELDDIQMNFLMEVALDIYWNYEYSTPTGIGVVIANMLFTYFDTKDSGEEIDFNDIFTEENIKEEYEWSDWN